MARRAPKLRREVSSEHWRALLRRYRFSNNIKQAALAADLGVTQAMVSRWESGLVEPSREMQARIYALLEDDKVSSPLIDWRNHTADQPGLAAVIDRTGRIETASTGLLRLLGRDRADIEGRAVHEVFTGDLLRLHRRLVDAGFFDEAVETVESADRYCFAGEQEGIVERYVQGLHWPHRGEDGEIRWMLTGAVVDKAEFEDLRRSMNGQVDMVPAG